MEAAARARAATSWAARAIRRQLAHRVGTVGDFEDAVYPFFESGTLFLKCVCVCCF